MRLWGMVVVGDRLFIDFLHVLLGVEYAEDIVVQRGNCKRYAMDRTQ